jgi:hypothetical protein
VGKGKEKEVDKKRAAFSQKISQIRFSQAELGKIIPNPFQMTPAFSQY